MVVQESTPASPSGLDPTVERLRECVDKGLDIRAQEGGFLLGEGALLPQNTACECPWVVKDVETKEMDLERTTLETLVFLVQSPPQWTWSQYMQASKRAKVSALSLWSHKSAKRFFALSGDCASPGTDLNRSRTLRMSSPSHLSISPHRLSRTSGVSPARGTLSGRVSSGSACGAGTPRGKSRRRLFSDISDSTLRECDIPEDRKAVKICRDPSVGDPMSDVSGDAVDCEAVTAATAAAQVAVSPSASPSGHGEPGVDAVGSASGSVEGTTPVVIAIDALSRAAEADHRDGFKDFAPNDAQAEAPTSAVKGVDELPASKCPGLPLLTVAGGIASQAIAEEDTPPPSPPPPPPPPLGDGVSLGLSAHQARQRQEQCILKTQGTTVPRDEQLRLPLGSSRDEKLVPSEGNLSSGPHVASMSVASVFSTNSSLAGVAIVGASTLISLPSPMANSADRLDGMAPGSSNGEQPRKVSAGDDLRDPGAAVLLDTRATNHGTVLHASTIPDPVSDRPVGSDGSSEVFALSSEETRDGSGDGSSVSKDTNENEVLPSGTRRTESDVAPFKAGGASTAAVHGTVIDTEVSSTAAIIENTCPAPFILAASTKMEGVGRLPCAPTFNTQAANPCAQLGKDNDGASGVAVETMTESPIADGVRGNDFSKEVDALDVNKAGTVGMMVPVSLAAEATPAAAAGIVGGAEPALSGCVFDEDARSRSSEAWRDEIAVVKQGVMRIGSVVKTRAGQLGMVRYSGLTEFATGLWLGLELDDPDGKNDGSHQDTRYFSCPQGHGLFVRPANVTPVLAVTHTSSLTSAPAPAQAPVDASTTVFSEHVGAVTGETEGDGSSERSFDDSGSVAVGGVGSDGKGVSEMALPVKGDANGSVGQGRDICVEVGCGGDNADVSTVEEGYTLPRCDTGADSPAEHELSNEASDHQEDIVGESPHGVGVQISSSAPEEKTPDRMAELPVEDATTKIRQAEQEEETRRQQKKQSLEETKELRAMQNGSGSNGNCNSDSLSGDLISLVNANSQQNEEVETPTGEGTSNRKSETLAAPAAFETKANVDRGNEDIEVSSRQGKSLTSRRAGSVDTMSHLAFGKDQENRAVRPDRRRSASRSPLGRRCNEKEGEEAETGDTGKTRLSLPLKSPRLSVGSAIRSRGEMESVRLLSPSTSPPKPKQGGDGSSASPTLSLRKGNSAGDGGRNSATIASSKVPAAMPELVAADAESRAELSSSESASVPPSTTESRADKRTCSGPEDDRSAAQMGTSATVAEENSTSLKVEKISPTVLRSSPSAVTTDKDSNKGECPTSAERSADPIGEKQNDSPTANMVAESRAHPLNSKAVADTSPQLKRTSSISRDGVAEGESAETENAVNSARTHQSEEGGTMPKRNSADRVAYTVRHSLRQRHVNAKDVDANCANLSRVESVHSAVSTSIAAGVSTAIGPTPSTPSKRAQSTGKGRYKRAALWLGATAIVVVIAVAALSGGDGKKMLTLDRALDAVERVYVESQRAMETHGHLPAELWKSVSLPSWVAEPSILWTGAAPDDQKQVVQVPGAVEDDRSVTASSGGEDEPIRRTTSTESEKGFLQRREGVRASGDGSWKGRGGSSWYPTHGAGLETEVWGSERDVWNNHNDWQQPCSSMPSSLSAILMRSSRSAPAASERASVGQDATRNFDMPAQKGKDFMASLDRVDAVAERMSATMAVADEEWKAAMTEAMIVTTAAEHEGESEGNADSDCVSDAGGHTEAAGKASETSGLQEPFGEGGTPPSAKDRRGASPVAHTFESTGPSDKSVFCAVRSPIGTLKGVTGGKSRNEAQETSLDSISMERFCSENDESLDNLPERTAPALSAETVASPLTPIDRFSAESVSETLAAPDAEWDTEVAIGQSQQVQERPAERNVVSEDEKRGDNLKTRNKAQFSASRSARRLREVVPTNGKVQLRTVPSVAPTNSPGVRCPVSDVQVQRSAIMEASPESGAKSMDRRAAIYETDVKYVSDREEALKEFWTSPTSSPPFSHTCDRFVGAPAFARYSEKNLAATTARDVRLAEIYERYPILKRDRSKEDGGGAADQEAFVGEGGEPASHEKSQAVSDTDVVFGGEGKNAASNDSGSGEKEVGVGQEEMSERSPMPEYHLPVCPAFPFLGAVDEDGLEGDAVNDSGNQNHDDVTGDPPEEVKAELQEFRDRLGRQRVMPWKRNPTREMPASRPDAHYSIGSYWGDGTIRRRDTATAHPNVPSSNPHNDGDECGAATPCVAATPDAASAGGAEAESAAGSKSIGEAGDSRQGRLLDEAEKSRRSSTESRRAAFVPQEGEALRGRLESDARARTTVNEQVAARMEALERIMENSNNREGFLFPVDIDPEQLPAFMRPGGGMVSVVLLTRCSASDIQPDGFGCDSAQMLFGHSSKNVIELREPGKKGPISWRSRQSVVTKASKAVGSKLSGLLRGASERSAGDGIPSSIAGLYLSEMSDGRLAMMRSSLAGLDDYDHGILYSPYDVDFGVVIENEAKGGVSCVGGEGTVAESAGCLPEGDVDKAENKGFVEVGVGGAEEGRLMKEGMVEGDTRERLKVDGEMQHVDGEPYAVMLAPGGHLCVFSTAGGFGCISRNNHRWKTHANGSERTGGAW